MWEIWRQAHKSRSEQRTPKGASKETEFRGLPLPCRYGKNIEAIRRRVKSVMLDVVSRRTHDALPLSIVDGIFRRRLGAPGLHLDKNQNVAVPCDQVDFSLTGSVTVADHLKPY